MELTEREKPRPIQAKNFLSEMLFKQHGKCENCEIQLYRDDIENLNIIKNKVYCKKDK